MSWTHHRHSRSPSSANCPSQGCQQHVGGEVLQQMWGQTSQQPVDGQLGDGSFDLSTQLGHGTQICGQLLVQI